MKIKKCLNKVGIVLFEYTLQSCKQIFSPAFSIITISMNHMLFTVCKKNKKNGKHFEEWPTNK